MPKRSSCSSAYSRQRFRIGLCAERLVLPFLLDGAKQLIQSHASDICHIVHALPSFPSVAGKWITRMRFNTAALNSRNLAPQISPDSEGF